MIKTFPALACAAVIALTIAPAEAGSRDAIMAECAKQLGFSTSGCTCIADKADDELTDSQQFLLVASITETEAERPSGLRELTPEEVEEVMTFLGQAPGVCANK
ncbi:MAG: hypothetical protein AAFV19_07695 [Pseudomonadota bacterium]